MKRKKLYSMLALGVAMSLTFSLPVSAASSPTTSTTVDKDETTGNTTTTTTEGSKEDGNYKDTIVVTDKDGNTLSTKVEEVKTDETTGEVTKTESVLGADNKPVKETTVKTDAAGKVLEVVKVNADTSKEIADWKAGEVEAGDLKQVEAPTINVEVKELNPESEEAKKAETGSKETFAKVDPNEVKVGAAGLNLNVKPVEAKHYAVAEEAAKQMQDAIIEKAGAVKNDSAPSIMAALSIEIKNYEKGKQYDVSIPLKDTTFEAGYDYFVLHCKSDGTWETVPARIVGDNIVIATFDDFSPVFIVRTAQIVMPDSEEESEGGSSEDSGSNESSGNSTYVAPAAVGLAKVGTTPAGSAANYVNPAVSPKTGE